MRLPERHPVVVDPDDARPLPRRRAHRPDTSSSAAAAQHAPEVAGLFGGGEQQGGLCRLGQALDLCEEDPFQVVAQRHSVGKGGAAGRVGRQSATLAVRAAQWVARRDVDERVAHPKLTSAHLRRAARARTRCRARRDATGAAPAPPAPPLRGRAPRTSITMPSASSRRATNVKASAEGSSSHCASSIRHSTGRSLGGVGEQSEHAERHQEPVVAGGRSEAERGVQRPSRWRAGRPTR